MKIPVPSQKLISSEATPKDSEMSKKTPETPVADLVDRPFREACLTAASEAVREWNTAEVALWNKPEGQDIEFPGRHRLVRYISARMQKLVHELAASSFEQEIRANERCRICQKLEESAKKSPLLKSVVEGVTQQIYRMK